MSDWYWKVISLKSAFLLSLLVCYIRGDDVVQKLPFCNPTHANDGPVYNDLMIVSTLDGKLTAFSTQNGVKVWDIDTQPLLSSNLHHVELTTGGKWVRLVPSLSGSLYSVSGETIEPLPFDAEQLLSSSYKYSEDLVIAGSRETSWVGVDSGTGSRVYECSARACRSPEHAPARDVLVLRTHAHTVRALDPRAGTERWNFSVASHQLALTRGECSGGAGAPAAAARTAVALHDGRLALRAPDGKQLIWQQKLEAPVASLWRLAGGSLQHMDVLWEAARTVSDSLATPPSLYVGVHHQQLYIQEGPSYVRKLETAVSSAPLPWKLVTASPQAADNTALTVQEDHSLSKITLYGPSGLTGDYGFFLYLQETCDQSVQVTEDALDSETTNNSEEIEHHHIHVHVYSLWFWWKEVLLIAISSALVMNLMIWPRMFPAAPPPCALPTNEFIVVERHYDPPPAPPAPFLSRYENDFTPLRCLGKGGFGVVFEAKNNIDHCSYAVKRIVLPVKESKRERMLREVRALAKLEHEHIVRYFNAWVEQPPPLWQQERDAVWMRELDGVSLMSEDTVTSRPAPGSVLLNLQQKPLDECVDALDYDKKLESGKRMRSLSCNDSISIVFDHESKTPSKHTQNTSEITTPNTLSKNVATDDDSFIVFGNPDETEHSIGHTRVETSAGHTGGRSIGHTKGHTTDPKSVSHISDIKSVGHGYDLSVGHKSQMGVKSNSGSPVSSGYSEAMKNSLDKRLERVKECDGYKTESTTNKKKKGHTRHWSLDLCVKPPESRLFLYIQMQLCRRDSLHDWLRDNRNNPMRAQQVVQLFRQIVSAVEYVHLAGLIHRDLKPRNILFALDGSVRVGDFGLATSMGDASQDGETTTLDPYQRHTHKVGTHLYMSPEQQRGLPYGYKVDIYSLGVILFELLQPFDTEAERVTCLMRLRSDIYPSHFHHKYPKEMKVLKLMLSPDPALRPTASGVRARAPLYEHTDQRYHFTLPAHTPAA